MRDNKIGILLLLDGVQVRGRATVRVVAGVLVHD